MVCQNPKCRHDENRHEWEIDTEVEVGRECQESGCSCPTFLMACQIKGCTGPAVRITVRFNSYTDATKRERTKPKVKLRLCFEHRYLHGFSWVNHLDPTRRARKNRQCQTIDCGRSGVLVEVQFRTHTDHSHRRQVRRSAWVCLCEEHRFIHGFAWTRKPFPFRSYGAFWEDLRLFGLRPADKS